MYVCAPCVCLILVNSIRLSGTGVMIVNFHVEPGDWGLNPGPLEDQPVFLTPELPLQAHLNLSLTFGGGWLGVETWSFYIALAALELRMLNRLASDLRPQRCICLKCWD